jgi:hypothetical protein
VRLGLAVATIVGLTGIADDAWARPVRLLGVGAAIELPPGWERWVNEEGEGLVNPELEIVVHLAAKGGNDCAAIDHGGRGGVREHGGVLPDDWHPRVRAVTDEQGLSDMVACRADRRGTTFAMVVFSSKDPASRELARVVPVFEALSKGLRNGWDKTGDVAMVQLLVHPTTGLELLLPMHASSWTLAPNHPETLWWNGGPLPSVTLQIDDPERLDVCNEIFSRAVTDVSRPLYVPGREAWPIAHLLDAAFLAAQY